MPVAEFLAIEGNAPKVPALILQGMKQTPDPLFPGIEKSKVFAAIDDLIAPRLILSPRIRFEKCSRFSEFFTIS